jgi:hypothetical protein
MKKILVALALFTSLLTSAQTSSPKVFQVTLDTIQHISFDSNLSYEAASSLNKLEYPYFMTGPVVWTYDLEKMTAVWKLGSQSQTYKIHSISDSKNCIVIAVGDETGIGWTDRITRLADGSWFVVSTNTEIKNGKVEGDFTLNAKITVK